MKVLTSELQAKLKAAFAVSEQRGAVAILGTVRLQLVKDQLIIQSTDLDTSYETTLKVDGEGCVFDSCISEAHYKLISKLKPDSWTQIIPADHGSNLELQCGKLNSEIVGVDGLEFPEIPQTMDSQFCATLDLAVLQITSKFAAKSDARPAINGVFIDGPNNALVTTDAQRMRVYDCVMPEFEGTTIMPLSTLKKALGVFGKKASVFLRKKDRYWILDDLQGNVLSYRNVNEQFPNYRAFVFQPRYHWEFDATELRAALKLLGAQATDRFNGVNFYPSEGRIYVEQANHEVGTTTMEVTAKGDVTAPVDRIGFNIKYVNESLADIDKNATIIEFGFVDHLNASMFRVNEACVDIIMPLRV